MMACLYGLEAVGLTSQGDLGRRRENRQSDPSGVGPWESAEPSPGAHAPLIKMRWGVATVIARQAAGLLPRPHDQACVIRSTATVIGTGKTHPWRTRPVSSVPDQSAGPSSQRRSRRPERLTTGSYTRLDYYCTPGG